MDKFKIVTPCHFGVESVLKREITDLGYDIVQVEDGRVTFEGDALAVCRANVFLRTAERVMIQVGRVKATHMISFLRLLRHWIGRSLYLLMESFG